MALDYTLVAAGVSLLDTKLSIPTRESAWWRARASIFYDWIRSGLDQTPGGFLLKTDLFDEASGPYHHANMAEIPMRFMGIDCEHEISMAAADRLREERIHGYILTADVHSLPFRTESVLAIFSLSTLDHFENENEIESALAELTRVLKPDGRILLVLDNPMNLEVATRAVLPSSILKAIRRDQFPLGQTLNSRNAQTMFNRLGLNVIKEEYLIHAIRYPMLTLANFVERKDWKRVNRWLEAWLIGRDRRRHRPIRRISGHYIAWTLEKDRQSWGGNRMAEGA